MIRSPFFYVGDKYKLMPQLLKYFPEKIDTYYEPFLGGGSSFLNVISDKYILNDISTEMIELHKFFKSKSDSPNVLLNNLITLAKQYNLSISCIGFTVPEGLKKSYKKTYYAKFNKEGYLKLRQDYNSSKSIELLYLLLVYGFNHMIRFNKSGLFNLPVGNVDFNLNTRNAILDYLNTVHNKKIEYYNSDFRVFLDKIEPQVNDFIYFDPPYLISNSEYNKLWNKELEIELYNKIDELHDEGIKFGLSNMLVHKGEENLILKEWMSKYNVYIIKSNYISFNDNRSKQTVEVYITNI